MNIIKDFAACCKVFMREWKRRAWIRKHRASIYTPF